MNIDKEIKYKMNFIEDEIEFNDGDGDELDYEGLNKNWPCNTVLKTESLEITFDNEDLCTYLQTPDHHVMITCKDYIWISLKEKRNNIVFKNESKFDPFIRDYSEEGLKKIEPEQVRQKIKLYYEVYSAILDPNELENRIRPKGHCANGSPVRDRDSVYKTWQKFPMRYSEYTTAQKMSLIVGQVWKNEFDRLYVVESLTSPKGYGGLNFTYNQILKHMNIKLRSLETLEILELDCFNFSKWQYWRAETENERIHRVTLLAQELEPKNIASKNAWDKAIATIITKTFGPENLAELEQDLKPLLIYIQNT